MTERSFPHALPADGQPDDGSIATEPRYRQVHRWDYGDGVLRGIGEELRVERVAGQLAVRIGTGEGRVDGEHYVNDEAIVKGLTPAHATKLRYDRIVLRLTQSGGRGRVRYVYVPGVPGAAGPPALVRTADAVEVSLAAFPVPAGAGVLPPFPLRSDRFATADRLGPLEPLAEFHYPEMNIPADEHTELRIPLDGGIFVGFDVNRYGSGAAGSYLTVLRDGMYAVGVYGRYVRESADGADDPDKYEAMLYVEARRGGIDGARITRIGNTGPPGRELTAYGELILRAGDVLVYRVYRAASTSRYKWTLSDSSGSLRATARFVRDVATTGLA